MRFVFMLLAAVSLTFVTACNNKKSGDGGPMAKLIQFKDEMCACKDKACAEQVSGALTKWKSEHKGEVGRVSADEKKEMGVALEEIGKCMTQLVTGDAAAGPGAAAGSGSE